MDERAVLPQIEIPRVRLLRQSLGANARQQLLVVVLALAAANDFPVALWCKPVLVQHGPRVVGSYQPVATFYETKSSSTSDVCFTSLQATSLATIQYSVRCRRVFDSSLRNVGPNPSTLPSAAAAAAT